MNSSPAPFSWRAFVRSLFELNDGPWRWRVGLEAGVAVAIPLLLFTLAGLQDIGLMASLGTFTVIYFAATERRSRVRALVPVALGLVACAALGVLAATSIWLTLAALIGVTVVACVLILGYRVGPPGPMMPVLVTGVSGHLAAPAAIGGAGVQPGVIVAMVAVGALSSLLVVAAPLAWRAVTGRSQAQQSPARAYGLFSFDQERRWVALRVILAVVIAGLLSVQLGLPRAYWVILACVAVLQATPRIRYTVARAIQRSLGTVLGVGIFWLIALPEPDGLWLVLTVALLQAGIEVVITRNYGLGLLLITPIALLISTSGSTAPLGQIITIRIADTLLGSVLALLVLFGLEWFRSWRVRLRSRL